MELTIISDTHGAHHGLVRSGDVLIHAGDFLRHGSYDDLERFAAWMDDLDFDHKIVVAGNHDLVFQRFSFHERPARKVLEDIGVTYLEDSGANINGLKFWGSPWTPDFFPERWVFNQPRNDVAVERWSQIPEDVEVLITHGPPKGILDACPDMFDATKTVNVGCAALRERVEQLSKLKLHVFGHIHESKGVFRHPSGTDFINAASLNGRYITYSEPVTTYEIDAPGENS